MGTETGLAFAEVGNFLQVEAGAERFADAGEKHGADIVVGLGMEQCVQGFLNAFQVQCVPVLRQVEDDLRDAIFDDIDDL